MKSKQSEQQKVRIFFGVIGFLFVLALAVAVWRVVDREILTSDGGGIGAGSSGSQKVVNGIATILQEKYKSTNASITTEAEDVVAPPHKMAVDGGSYYIVSDSGASVSVQSFEEYGIGPDEAEEFARPIVDSIVEQLKTYGLREDSSSIFGNTYASEHVVCRHTGLLMMPIMLYCGDIESYERAARGVADFIRAYDASKPLVPVTQTAFGRPSVTPSANYSVGEVPVQYANGGSSLARYYKKIGSNNDWRLFIVSSGAVIECSKFDTVDIRTAFQGETCVENGNFKSVKP